jgi:hypothetical protein
MLRVRVRRHWAGLAIVLLLVVTIFFIRHRAVGAREQPVVGSAGARIIPTRFQAIDPPAALTAESIPSASEFRDAALFKGTLYLCGPSGLYSYNAGGTLAHSYRTGRELPAGELRSVSKTATQLLIATAGAGALLFDGIHFQQILPADPKLRSFTTILGLSSGRVLLGTAGRGVLV